MSFRRTGTRRGGRNRGSAIPSPKVPWAKWRADQGVVLESGKVASWEAYLGGQSMQQALSTKQPVFNASDSNLNGRASMTFDGANTRIESANPLGDWTFLHSGAGMTCFIVGKLTQLSDSIGYLMSTRPSAGSGMLLRLTSGAQFLYRAYNSSSALCANEAINGVNGDPFLIEIRLGASESPPVDFKVNALQKTRDPLLAIPTETAPVTTLAIGDHATLSTSSFKGELAEMVFYREYLSDDEAGTARDSLKAYYGLA